jgi:hypothetical protein
MADSISGIMGLIGQVGSSATGVPPYQHAERPKYSEPQDRVTISDRAKQKGRQKMAGAKNEADLSPEEKQQVGELKKRDAEVKAHEQAHMAAGGAVVQGGASYQYEHGPDGKMYAVGGEVKIDVSPERTPEATVRKMQQVQRAALAPAQPSGTDRAVAARAAQAEAQARLEISDSTQASTDIPSAPSGQASSAMAKSDRPAADASNGPKPFDANVIFSYKADLSPAGRRAPETNGQRIDLSI